MLIRDKIGDNLLEATKDMENEKFEIIELATDEEFFDAIMSKLKDEIEMLHITKSVHGLAEIIELVDWIQISLGTKYLDKIIENRKEKLGLYWKKYYIKDFDERTEEE
jgi:predicted house-cleaning noncanonical NTP pyrophosphatase (MazG superfamily)